MHTRTLSLSLSLSLCNKTHMVLFISRQMNLEMETEAIFPPSGPYHSQQFDNSHFLWFEIIAPTVAADSVKDTNTTCEKGALNLETHNKKDKPHPSASQKYFTQDITNTSILKRISCCVYFFFFF
jgi:hypothetical protein